MVKIEGLIVDNLLRLNLLLIPLILTMTELIFLIKDYLMLFNEFCPSYNKWNIFIDDCIILPAT